jgi:hypothetical protein
VFIEAGAIIEEAVCLRRQRRARASCGRCAVQAFTRLVGPLYIGRMHADDRQIAASSIGDVCKVQVSEQHDIHRAREQGSRRLRRPFDSGTLGQPRRRHDHEQPEEHLRHRAALDADGIRETGMQFLGTLFGDHAKTASGSAHHWHRARRGLERVRRRDAAEGRGAILVGRGRRVPSYRLDKFLDVGGAA